jgi:hypothetical protein
MAVLAGLALVLPGQASAAPKPAALQVPAVPAPTTPAAPSAAGVAAPTTAAAAPSSTAAPTTAVPAQSRVTTASKAPATASTPAQPAPRRDRRGDHQRAQAPQPVQAAQPNPDCTLSVPADPASAAGLVTPYELSATDRGNGACHETNTDQSAFVEAAIIDPATGALSVYHPVVVDEGTAPAAPPVPVTLPRGAVVGVWFGFNGGTLTLDGPGAGSCVNGVPGSPFGQFAYCNAGAFFDAANAAISAGKLTVPALGTGRDGLPCPTTRDFAVVDQDQSDNLATAYRVVDGAVGQNTAATRGGTPLTNGSDEGLLAKAIDPALGCTPFEAPDLGDGGAMSPALALNELSAAAHQAAPAALTPTSDPMTQVDGRADTGKTNLYRVGVDQPPLPAGQTPEEYCTNLRDIAQTRLDRDRGFFRAAPSPAPTADSLYGFLATRYRQSLTNLNCGG